MTGERTYVHELEYKIDRYTRELLAPIKGDPAEARRRGFHKEVMINGRAIVRVTFGTKGSGTKREIVVTNANVTLGNPEGSFLDCGTQVRLAVTAACSFVAGLAVKDRYIDLI